MNSFITRSRSWLREERANSDGKILVHGRRIYILPTRYGLLFGALLFLMLIGSLNYDNNPAYLLTFLLIGLSLNAMLQTWRNLRGVSLYMQPAAPGFVGDKFPLRFVLSASDERPHYAVSLQLDDAAAVTDIGDQSQSLQLDWQPQQRGWQQPGLRLQLATRYPLGLFRAWCRVRLDDQVLVYPRPGEPVTANTTTDARQNGQQTTTAQGTEDFDGLRDYRKGDSARQIDWKTLARERGLMSKQFHDAHAPVLLISWESLHSLSVEARLSQLARAVIDAEAQGQPYRLQLPQQNYGPDLGSAHRHRCLQALALFGNTP